MVNTALLLLIRTLINTIYLYWLHDFSVPPAKSLDYSAPLLLSYHNQACKENLPMRPSVIVITGASSGIGAALADLYAAPGVTLGLLGRSGERLAAVTAHCIAKGAAVHTGTADVRDREAINQWLTRFDNTQPIDLLIANAGISAGTGGQGESSQQVRDIFSVNVDGTFNTVLPLIPRMQARRRGQIALMSSLAGIRGLPSCPAYSASKMAVRGFGEGLRGLLKKEGIHVSVICPGYVRTPMTEVNRFPMPFIMTPEKAARIIRSGLAANKAHIAFPRRLYLPLCWASALPSVLIDPFFAALPAKTAME
jgi:short-subunit dehydrogenase